VAGNYVVADFCDRAGPFLKFKENRHIVTRKLRFWFRFCLKTSDFRFENRRSASVVRLLVGSYHP